MFDNPRVRGLYASLSDGWVYLNAATSPQLPERVAGAVARAFRSAPLLAPPELASGSHARAARLGARIGEGFYDAARFAIADLVGARQECVVLGTSRTQLLTDFAHTLSRRLRIGNEVVLSRIDDSANIEAWRHAADLYGAHIRWAEPDLSTGVLPAWQYTGLVSPDTAVVAVAAANSHVGTVTDIPSICRTAHSKSDAIVVVDVDSIASFARIDMADLDADVVALDVGSLGGPSVGALVFRSAEFMDDILPIFTSYRTSGEYSTKDYRVGGDSDFGYSGTDYSGSEYSSTSYAVSKYSSTGQGLALRGDSQQGVLRARRLLEPVGLSEGLLGGVSATVDHWADMGSDEDGNSLPGTRRRRLERGLPPATEYVHGLARRLVEGLQIQPSVHVIGVDGEMASGFGYDSVPRIPRVSFFVDEVSAEAVDQRLLSQGIVTSVIKPGDSMLLGRMGVFEEGAGAVCVGLSAHNTISDVDRLLRAVASLR